MYTYIKKQNSLQLPSELQTILDSLCQLGARPILVGGCVRDHFLQKPLKDYDIEVYDIESYDDLCTHLSLFGKVELVGKSFGVTKLFTQEYEYDFALPRTERKIATGHQGFEVQANAQLNFNEAALRRDFTINALGYDVKNDTFLDPFDGLTDLNNKILRHINDKTFVEDPLRVYRALQFAARFEFDIHEKTLMLCEKMIAQDEFKTLSKERIFEEFKKFLLQSCKPSLGFKWMKRITLISHFPQLQALIGCIQDKEYHPEGDVWIHTLMCLDEMVKLKNEDKRNNLVLMLAILCHDLGKPFCTKEINGRITSHKHEVLGEEPTRSFLAQLCNEQKLIDEVVSLVKYHLAPFQFYLHDSSIKAVKRLSLKVNIENLCKVALADCLGRDIKNKNNCHKAVHWLLNEAQKLNIQCQAIQPLVLGRDLIALGLKPSKAFSSILSHALDLQIEQDKSKEEILQILQNTYC
jgi:tRNA nucleotidyltransferase (CCA-adding enzyme)